MNKTETSTAEKYIEAVGRRKNAIARVRLFLKKGGVTINGRDYKAYFPIAKYQSLITAPIETAAAKVTAIVKVTGGGLTGQAEAVRHGIARALIKIDSANRPQLKVLGFLKRDPRMVERKKYGLKKARRAPQWAKR